LINQVDLRVLELEWNEKYNILKRSDIFKIATTEAKAISNFKYPDSASNYLLPIHGDDYSGSLWLTTSSASAIASSEGTIDILNEGIFVASESSSVWLSDQFGFYDGYINFSSKSVNLPVGRDRVIKDELFKNKSNEIQNNSIGMIDLLVNITSSCSIPERDSSALIISHIIKNADDTWSKKIMKRLGGLNLSIYKRDERISLSDILRLNPVNVYIQCPVGRFVSDLTTIDGKQLYHKKDDYVDLQSAILAQGNHIVIAAARDDSSDTVVLEADLLIAFFQKHGIKAIDLTKTNVISGRKRSKRIPNSVKQLIGDNVKFVEVDGLPNNKTWRVGDSVWINISNPTMSRIFKMLNTKGIDENKIKLSLLLIDILAFKFEDAISFITDWLDD